MKSTPLSPPTGLVKAELGKTFLKPAIAPVPAVLTGVV